MRDVTANRTDRRIKVLLLGFAFDENVVPLANGLADHADVYLVLSDHSARSVLHQIDPRVHFWPFRRPRLRQAHLQPGMVLSLLRHIWRIHPDVIHMQQGHPWFNLALPLLGRYPLVLTVHDPEPHLGDIESQKNPQSLFNFGYRHATRIVAHSRWVRDQLVSRWSIPDQLIDVVPLAAPIESDLGSDVTEGVRNVLFLGRIWEYKGLRYLIEAEPRISASVSDVKIVIAGRGEDMEPYRRLMIHPNRFEVHNRFVSNQERSELIRRASLVVLPYVDATQSAVIPLAYQFGKPVVATKVGSLPEVVEDGRSGYLVPPRDPSALADAIVALLQDPALRREMGAFAKRKGEAEFAPHAVARQMLNVYRKTLGLPEISPAWAAENRFGFGH